MVQHQRLHQLTVRPGEITFNSGVAGSWATCVVIEEWRCGQKVGEIYRDIPIVTLACTPPTGLCAPHL